MGILSETEEVVGVRTLPILWTTSRILCFRGTRETRKGLEQGDRIALKLPPGERIHV